MGGSNHQLANDSAWVFRKMKPEYLIIHHSASSRDKTTLTDINNWHTARGFPVSKFGSYIGYHYVVLADGQMIQMRREDEIGAHAKEGGMNFKSLGICLTGNFEEEEPTIAQLNSLHNFLAQKVREYSIPMDKVIAHKEIPFATACCGKNLMNWLNKYRGSAGSDAKTKLISLAEEILYLSKQL